MKIKFIFLFSCIIFLASIISLSSANSNFGYTNRNLPGLSPGINYSAINVNNSQFLRSLTPQQVADLFTELDPIFLIENSSLYRSGVNATFDNATILNDLSVGNSILLTKNADGGDVSLTIRNTALAGSTDETVSLIAQTQSWQVEDADMGKIVFGRMGDYSGEGTSFIDFYTANNFAVDTLALRIDKYQNFDFQDGKLNTTGNITASTVKQGKAEIENSGAATILQTKRTTATTSGTFAQINSLNSMGTKIAHIHFGAAGGNTGGNIRFATTPPAQATTERMRITQDGYVGIGTISPTYPLEVVGNVSTISIWSDGNVSATGYIIRTSVFDKSSGNALDFIQDADYYLDENGDVVHSNFYGYAGSFNITDYSRPEYIEEEVCNEPVMEEVCEVQEICSYELIGKYYQFVCNNQLICWEEHKVLDFDLVEKCAYNEVIINNESIGYEKICEMIETNYTYAYNCHNETIITYPHKKTEEGVLLDAEVDVLRQALFDMKNETCSRDNTWSWCK